MSPLSGTSTNRVREFWYAREDRTNSSMTRPIHALPVDGSLLVGERMSSPTDALERGRPLKVLGKEGVSAATAVPTVQMRIYLTAVKSPPTGSPTLP